MNSKNFHLFPRKKLEKQFSEKNLEGEFHSVCSRYHRISTALQRKSNHADIRGPGGDNPPTLAVNVGCSVVRGGGGGDERETSRESDVDD